MAWWLHWEIYLLLILNLVQWMFIFFHSRGKSRSLHIITGGILETWPQQTCYNSTRCPHRLPTWALRIHSSFCKRAFILNVLFRLIIVIKVFPGSDSEITFLFILNKHSTIHYYIWGHVFVGHVGILFSSISLDPFSKWSILKWLLPFINTSLFLLVIFRWY